MPGKHYPCPRVNSIVPAVRRALDLKYSKTFTTKPQSQIPPIINFIIFFFSREKPVAKSEARIY